MWWLKVYMWKFWTYTYFHKQTTLKLINLLRAVYKWRWRNLMWWRTIWWYRTLHNILSLILFSPINDFSFFFFHSLSLSWWIPSTIVHSTSTSTWFCNAFFFFQFPLKNTFNIMITCTHTKYSFTLRNIKTWQCKQTCAMFDHGCIYI